MSRLVRNHVHFTRKPARKKEQAGERIVRLPAFGPALRFRPPALGRQPPDPFGLNVLQQVAAAFSAVSRCSVSNPSPENSASNVRSACRSTSIMMASAAQRFWSFQYWQLDTLQNTCGMLASPPAFSLPAGCGDYSLSGRPAGGSFRLLSPPAPAAAGRVHSRRPRFKCYGQSPLPPAMQRVKSPERKGRNERSVETPCGSRCPPPRPPFWWPPASPPPCCGRTPGRTAVRAANKPNTAALPEKPPPTGKTPPGKCGPRGGSWNGTRN